MPDHVPECEELDVPAQDDSGRGGGHGASDLQGQGVHKWSKSRDHVRLRLGGQPLRPPTRRSTLPASGQWEDVELELEVRSPPVSVAIGFDYGFPERELFIDDVRVDIRLGGTGTAP